MTCAADVKVKEKIMDRVSIVKKILDVFLEDLLTVPPTRAVDFRIKLEPGTRDISKAVYCMGQAELKEPKVQLLDLLDKGFIFRSISL